MRKTVPVRIGELWEEYLSAAPSVSKKLAEARIADLWPQIAGPLIASYTSSVKIEKGVLHVSVTSSVVRYELVSRRIQLCKAVNKAAGMELVKSVLIR